MYAISLFSGAGGDTLGMTQANIKVTGYSELIPQFCNTHETNLSDSNLIKNNIFDITDNEWELYKGKCNIIFAGFPCQSHLNAGKKNPNDPRGQLYLEFVRAVSIIKPDFIIGENVKGLLSRKDSDGAFFIDKIKKSFEELGYNISYKVLNCVNYNVPQTRERLIILGHKTKVLTFPVSISSKKTLNLKSIIKFDLYGAVKISKDTFDMTSIPTECIIENNNNTDIPDIKNAHPYLIMKINTPTKSYGGKDYTSLFSFGKRISPIHCEIIDIRQPSKTIICTYDHQPRLFVPIKNKNGYYLRTLLPDELKQIQGFPNDYIITGNTKQKTIQIGNAVPPPLVKSVLDHILSV